MLYRNRFRVCCFACYCLGWQPYQRMKRHLAREAAILINNIAFSGVSIPKQHQRIGDCIALPDAHKICADH